VAKSPNEQIRELTTDVRVLEAGNEALRAQLADLNTADQRQQEEVTRLRSELAESRQEVAVLKQQLQDHIKQTDLADGRRWALIVLLLGAVLSLASGLIVSLTRK
jgi:predicted  nucleic acid-binding Zn-ribbon protein